MVKSASALLLVLATLVGIQVHQGTEARAAAGCPDPRVFVETQAWWKPNPDTAGGVDFGHVHLGACIPERDALRTNTVIPLQLIMHGNPGTLRDISVVFKGKDQEETVAKVAPSQRTCSGTCVITASAPIRIQKFEASGLQEIRFRAYVDQPDGNLMHTSLNFQAKIRNGKPWSPVSRMPYLRAKGWYTDYGYCEADILTVPLPDQPVSGVMTMRVQQVDHGPDDVDPTAHMVAIDTDAHAGDPGTILRQGTGRLPPTRLDIDTTQLTNGVHKLVQRVDCAEGNQINSGVSVMRFEVFNEPGAGTPRTGLPLL